ncbi:type IV pilin [Natronobacterium texcoconense]|uniref:Flagellin N-terminal-like domain-containing protein n=1 Tax=Natronobacterium texcoconense TaxID=1095778 RepID=A0A1H0ZPZ1_NATTX|nr:type IV pilin N-terminal domain-containing protein [Natronobacterium texcoconense]SDQ29483.1 flagellin N-terminal-like domain-containing protein [Natronobacterium texcoconense]
MFETVTKRLHGNADERGVSPVIGVILMVAITVILAAVIATFVLGIGDDIQQDPQAGVSIDDSDSSAVEVSLTSLGNADGVAIVDASDGGVIPEPESGNAVLSSTGMTATVTDENVSYSVVAYIGDDSELGESDVPDDELRSTAVIDSFEVED